MTDASSGIRNERILFQPAEDQAREEITEFSTIAQRVLIGRKLSGDENAQATPVYLLKMDVGDRIGPTEVAGEDQAAAGHHQEEETPRGRIGHRHGGRRGRHPGRERPFLVADLGRRALLPRHRRPGQHRAAAETEVR